MSNLIIVCGLPGAGKSTLAKGLAQELRLPVFSVDPIESSIIKAGISKSFETGLAAYIVAETLADENLKLANSVIIDAVSAQNAAKQMWRDLSKKHESKLIIIECVCSDEAVHKQRIEARVRNLHGIPEVTWEDIVQRKREYVAWNEPVFIIDSMNETTLNQTKAFDFITSLA